MKITANRTLLSWFFFALFLYTVPLYVKSLHWLGILTFANIFVLFTVSYDISSGHTGYLNFGQTFFLALGGYTSAILTKYLGFPLYPSIIIASFTGMILGSLVIIPAFRVRGPYFLMLSLALPLFMTSLFRMGSISKITGGQMGIFPLPVLSTVPERAKSYILTLTIMLIISFILRKISNSNIGNVFKAIHQDEDLVNNMGYNSFKYKIIAFAINGFVAGLGGALWVHNIGSVGPHSILDLYIMIEIVIAVNIGGSGTIIGPMIGSFFCMIFLEALRPIAPGAWRLLIFTIIGGSLIAIKPNGVFIEIIMFCNKKVDDFSLKTRSKVKSDGFA